MVYNPELVKELLGEEVAKLFDGTIEIIPSNKITKYGLTVGDILEFKFKSDNFKPRQFMVK